MKVSKIAKVCLVAGASLSLLVGCGSSSGNASKNEIVFWNPFTGADSSNLKK